MTYMNIIIVQKTVIISYNSVFDDGILCPSLAS